MDTPQLNTYKQGILYTAGSYFLWGILPLYWKMVENVSAEEILAHRVFWSFLFMIGLLTFNKEWKNIKVASKRIIQKPMLLLSLVLSSLLISLNWFVYIWSVNNGHIIETSLGYYINPLISVILGMIFFKERLNLWQKLSFVVAAIGVVLMTLHYGKFPWVALTLALSFGLYGLTKKMTKLSSSVGLTFETMVVTPIAGYYLVMMEISGKLEFFSFDLSTTLLLVGAGIVTAVPLLLFASGAQRIPLFMVGVLQYIAPTITLIIGVILFNEPFTNIEVITFSFIWCALLLFTLSNSKYFRKVEVKLTRKNSIGM
ncbi:EamA family transporter RarD [Metabacillus sediminilitoris]|uniref:EamA family transporter RarD n=1 Tax=Metabacillus sediminilitoris TaxID=2567941 RepID=A0A4S4BMA6_9BACI|nr:EamA family transporter RarD [Metabacillus sediminilitoris]QGQ46554.1 EamA family transporter RarD [Metabacillus sediminilitoris]THF75950.1 EamA family transporter RarD [Metabacillus sediminilitoris]